MWNTIAPLPYPIALDAGLSRPVNEARGKSFPEETRVL
jgi:hypothetical protein